MIKRIAGLFLLLAVLFALPTFGQNSTPAPAQEKSPLSIVLMADKDNPPTPAAQTLVDTLTKILSDGFTISNTKPGKDDPTQYVIVIMAFGTTNVVGGKQVPSNVLNVTGKLHVKGHDFGYYLFSAPLQIETDEEATEVAGLAVDILGSADAAIAEDGGPDKL
jgi:hypothetical protein